ncbi:MAG: flagellar basal body-associated FliL family protein [Kiloniellales bacterium]|nr:flagellar basal body-associated FliL family protein [Kiloniellales bacterium]
MTDEALAEDAGEDLEVEAKPKSKGLAGKKLVLLIVLPIVLLLAGGAGIFFSGLLDGLLGGSPPEEGAEAQEQQVAAPAVFYELPEMLVNLNSSGNASAFLRLSVSLELRPGVQPAVLEKVLPRIVDNFQVYLRELRVEDLSGSAGLQRLREELLKRVNAAAQSNVVKDVLFKEMLVQ